MTRQLQLRREMRVGGRPSRPPLVVFNLSNGNSHEEQDGQELQHNERNPTGFECASVASLSSPASDDDNLYCKTIWLHFLVANQTEGSHTAHLQHPPNRSIGGGGGGGPHQVNQATITGAR